MVAQQWLATLMALNLTSPLTRIADQQLNQFLDGYSSIVGPLMAKTDFSKMKLFKEFQLANREHYTTLATEMNGRMVQEANLSRQWNDAPDLSDNQRMALSRIQQMATMVSDQQMRELVVRTLDVQEILFKTVCMEKLETNTTCTSWTLYGQLIQYFANRHNNASDEMLLHYWTEWHKEDEAMAEAFLDLLDLMLVASQAAGYKDTAQHWNARYAGDKTAPSFDVQAWSSDAFYKLLPLYEELHAYVRGQLTNGDQLTIAGHRVGELFADNWQHLYYNTVRPRQQAAPLQPLVDGIDLVKTVVSHAGRLGLDTRNTCKSAKKCEAMRPAGRLLCQPTVYDSGQLAMCTTGLAEADLHEMFRLVGRLLYSQAYKRQKAVYYQQPAAPGLADAVGKLLALTFDHPENWVNNGWRLADNFSWTEDWDMEVLYRQALIQLPTVMHDYADDMWKWQLLQSLGERRELNLTSQTAIWWTLVGQYSGLHRPVAWQDNVDVVQVPRLATMQATSDRMLATVYAFQLLQNYCDLSGLSQGGGLHRCNLAKWGKVGPALEQAMQKGAQKHWLTVFGPPSVDGMLRYFQPLYYWLQRHNDYGAVCRGWAMDDQWPADVLDTLSPMRCGNQATSTPRPTTTAKPGGGAGKRCAVFSGALVLPLLLAVKWTM